MWLAVVFLFGFGLANTVADTSEYAEIARNAVAEEREEAQAAKAEDIALSSTKVVAEEQDQARAEQVGAAAGTPGMSPAGFDTHFDSQLLAAQGELNGIMSGVGKQDSVHGAALNPIAPSADTEDAGGFAPEDAGDFAPEDAMRLHLAQLQTKVQAGDGVIQKLRGAVLARDQEIHQAEGIMKKELSAIQSAVDEEKKEAGMESQLKTEQVSLQKHINRARHSFQSTESQTKDEEAKRVSTGAEAAKLRNDIKIANDNEAADEKKLAEFKEQSESDSAQDNAKIQNLQATITAMQSRVAGGIASHVRWQKNATALAQKLQEAKATLRSMLVAKQSSDVDMSQVVGRWKDSLAQLTNQVKMNADLKSRASQDGQAVVDHLQDLKQQIHDRDIRIAQLKQRLAQHH